MLRAFRRTRHTTLSKCEQPLINGERLIDSLPPSHPPPLLINFPIKKSSFSLSHQRTWFLFDCSSPLRNDTLKWWLLFFSRGAEEIISPLDYDFYVAARNKNESGGPVPPPRGNTKALMPFPHLGQTKWTKLQPSIVCLWLFFFRTCAHTIISSQFKWSRWTLRASNSLFCSHYFFLNTCYISRYWVKTCSHIWWILFMEFVTEYYFTNKTKHVKI